MHHHGPAYACLSKGMSRVQRAQVKIPGEPTWGKVGNNFASLTFRVFPQMTVLYESRGTDVGGQLDVGKRLRFASTAVGS